MDKFMSKFNLAWAMAGRPVVTLDGRSVTDFRIDIPKAPQTFADAKRTENYSQGISAIIHNPTGKHRYPFYHDGTAHLYGGTTLSDLMMVEVEVSPVSEIKQPKIYSPSLFLDLAASFSRLHINYRFLQLREITEDIPHVAVMNLADGSTTLTLTSQMMLQSLVSKADLSEKISALICRQLKNIPDSSVFKIAHDVWNRDLWFGEMEELYEFLQNKKLAVIGIRFPSADPKVVIEIQFFKEGDLCQLP